MTENQEAIFSLPLYKADAGFLDTVPLPFFQLSNKGFDIFSKKAPRSILPKCVLKKKIFVEFETLLRVSRAKTKVGDGEKF